MGEVALPVREPILQNGHYLIKFEIYLFPTSRFHNYELGMDQF